MRSTARTHPRLTKQRAGETAKKAVEIAALLQADLDEKVPGYSPDEAITHCGKRKCTAGKLWKRAEDYRKDELVSVRLGGS